MRGNGKTTRTVDYAIQMLFKHKFIQIPTSMTIHGMNPNNYILDPDCENYPDAVGVIQKHLHNRIVKRLQSEHPRVQIKIKRTIISIEK